MRNVIVPDKAVPSNLWTIARPDVSIHPSDVPLSHMFGISSDKYRLFDDLVIVFGNPIRFSYPRQITHLWDKSDPNKSEEHKTLVCDQFIYTKDDRVWSDIDKEQLVDYNYILETVTCKGFLFETEEEAMDYLINIYLIKSADRLMSLTDTCNNLLDLIERHKE